MFGFGTKPEAEKTGEELLADVVGQFEAMSTSLTDALNKFDDEKGQNNVAIALLDARNNIIDKARVRASVVRDRIRDLVGIDNV